MSITEKQVRLSIDVLESLRAEMKIYTSLTKGTSLQSITTDQMLRFLREESQKDCQYSKVANQRLLSSAPGLITEPLEVALS